MLSLPTRERELKLSFKLNNQKIILVAPHTGAWIEIMIDKEYFEKIKVAPHTGAWIEICNALTTVNRLNRVAPHTGAWIEISTYLPVMELNKSRSPHGSVNWNHHWKVIFNIKIWSLPTRERELKYGYNTLTMLLYFVAPHTGAWIEINNNNIKYSK